MKVTTEVCGARPSQVAHHQHRAHALFQVHADVTVRLLTVAPRRNMTTPCETSALPLFIENRNSTPPPNIKAVVRFSVRLTSCGYLPSMTTSPTRPRHGRAL